MPIKRVVDPFAKVRPLPDGSGVDTSSVRFEINPFDEIALEEAVRIREKQPDTEVITVTIGAAEAEEQLRKALAIGADKAILIESTDTWDPPAVAKELEALARELQPDLVLMGKQATDDDANQVGQMLAARLDWPQATNASNIEFCAGAVSVTRETDTGEEVLGMELPAVVTTDLRLNEPRYIALPGIIKARSKPLGRRAPITTPTAKTRVIGVEQPAARAAGRKLASVDELVSALRDKGVL